jgi:citrate lyase subunit gamma (acyl carrier protein)
MKPKIAAQSGTFESSDVIFLIEPLPEHSGRKLEISSTVMQQFGVSFNPIIVEMLDQYEMTDIHLIAKGKGALEPTIKAPRNSYQTVARPTGRDIEMKNFKKRRTMLYIPGNNPAMIQQGGIYGTDSILLDLEDAVALNQKDAAAPWSEI